MQSNDWYRTIHILSPGGNIFYAGVLKDVVRYGKLLGRPLEDLKHQFGFWTLGDWIIIFGD